MCFFCGRHPCCVASARLWNILLPVRQRRNRHGSAVKPPCLDSVHCDVLCCLSALLTVLSCLAVCCVSLCQGKTARIHVAELQERLSRPPVPNPLAAFKVDQEVEAGEARGASTLGYVCVCGGGCRAKWYAWVCVCATRICRLSLGRFSCSRCHQSASAQPCAASLLCSSLPLCTFPLPPPPVSLCVSSTPFSALCPAAYLGHPRTLSKRTKDLQLSLRPSALNAAKEVGGVCGCVLGGRGHHPHGG